MFRSVWTAVALQMVLTALPIVPFQPRED